MRKFNIDFGGYCKQIYRFARLSAIRSFTHTHSGTAYNILPIIITRIRMRHNESRKNTRSELVCVILYDTRPFVFRTWQTRYGLCITSKLDLHLKLLQTHTDTRAHKKWAQPTQSSAETKNVSRLFGC